MADTGHILMQAPSHSTQGGFVFDDDVGSSGASVITQERRILGPYTGVISILCQPKTPRPAAQATSL